MERLTGRHGQCLRSTSPVPAEWSVFYKAIRRRNGPLPMGACSIYRYLAECLSAWVRNQVICRYVLPRRPAVLPPLLGARPPSPSAYFPPDCHPRGSRNGTPRYVLRREKEPLSPLPRTYIHAHIYVHKGLVLHFVRYPPAFILRESILRVAPRLL